MRNLIEKLAVLKQAFKDVDDAWSGSLKDFNSGAYPFDKSFDELTEEVAEWCDAFTYGLEDELRFINNKKIALFEGYEEHIDDKSLLIYHTESGNEAVYVDTLNYHSDWNLLMNAVVEISDIKGWSLNATLEWLSDSQDRDGLYNMRDIYEAVLEFIDNQKH